MFGCAAIHRAAARDVDDATRGRQQVHSLVFTAVCLEVQLKEGSGASFLKDALLTGRARGRT